MGREAAGAQARAVLRAVMRVIRGIQPEMRDMTAAENALPGPVVVLLPEFFGNHGKLRAPQKRDIYCDISLAVINIGHYSARNSRSRHLHKGFNRLLIPISRQKKIAMGQIPIVSRLHDEDGIEEGQQDPRKTPKSGFIQAPAFIEQRVPARGRADIPPGGARSRTPRSGGTRAAG